MNQASRQFTASWPLTGRSGLAIDDEIAQPAQHVAVIAKVIQRCTRLSHQCVSPLPSRIKADGGRIGGFTSGQISADGFTE